MGAFVNAQFVGSIVIIFESFNREGQKHQEMLEMSDSAMRNIGLKLTLQGRIREF